MENLPKISELVDPVVHALIQNGPLRHDEIETKVVALMNIPDHLRRIIRSGRRSELSYRLSWARTKAKSLGLIERNDQGCWQVTDRSNKS